MLLGRMEDERTFTKNAPGVGVPLFRRQTTWRELNLLNRLTAAYVHSAESGFAICHNETGSP